jgi:hypothetical protein
MRVTSAFRLTFLRIYITTYNEAVLYDFTGTAMIF